MTRVHIDPTIEGVLVRFVDPDSQREAIVRMTRDDALALSHDLLMVALFHKPADPSELLNGAAWKVAYRCGCKAMAPTAEELKELCPEHGAGQETPPALEAA